MKFFFPNKRENIAFQPIKNPCKKSPSPIFTLETSIQKAMVSPMSMTVPKKLWWAPLLPLVGRVLLRMICRLRLVLSVFSGSSSSEFGKDRWFGIPEFETERVPDPSDLQPVFLTRVISSSFHPPRKYRGFPRPAEE